jgi:hypothetical protein
MLKGKDARSRFQAAIKAEFAKQIKKREGHFAEAGEDLGVSRHMVELYAAGSVPRGDVLLTAFIKWSMVIRIENPDAASDEPRFWECSMTRKDKPKQKRPESAQLSLFKAIDELEPQNLEVRILRKGPQKIELAVDIAFPNGIL